MKKFNIYGIVIATVILIVTMIIIVTAINAIVGEYRYNNVWIMGAIALFFILSYMYSILAIKIDKNKGLEKFYKLLTAKVKKNLISSKEDIIILLNSISREYNSDYSVASILEDYLVYTTDKEELSNENYNFLKAIIKEETEEKPFSNTPEEERRLLRNINNSIKNNDLKSIKDDLQELNTVISAKNRIYQRTDKINNWSLPCAVIGIILTIIFGVMSFRKVDYKIPEEFYKKLIEESIQEYKKNPNEND